MIVLPAIDLKDHQVVRLRKGEFDTVHRVAEDPLQTARAFAAAGAKYIHMVDLDGARSGARKNEAEVRAVAEHSGLKVELGGGLRTLADLEAADAMTGYVVGADGSVTTVTLRLGALTDDERQILADGCLINYYKNH